MAERVVDLLEAVEVHEHDRGAVAAPLGGAERDLGPVAEHHPVGQVGQRVLEREALADDRLPAGAVDRDERQDEQRQRGGAVVDGEHRKRREAERDHLGRGVERQSRT